MSGVVIKDWTWSWIAPKSSLASLKLNDINTMCLTLKRVFSLPRYNKNKMLKAMDFIIVPITKLLCSCFRGIDIHEWASCLVSLKVSAVILVCFISGVRSSGLHAVFSIYHTVFEWIRTCVCDAFSFFVATDVLWRCSQRIDVCVWVLSSILNGVQAFFVCSAPNVLSLRHRCSMKMLPGDGSL